MKILSSATATDAAAAYARTQSGFETTEPTTDIDAEPGSDFGSVVQGAVQSAIASGHAAEGKAASGLSGQGNVTDIVSSISQAQIILQTATVVRDRVIQSYQDLMRMSI